MLAGLARQSPQMRGPWCSDQPIDMWGFLITPYRSDSSERAVLSKCEEVGWQIDMAAEADVVCKTSNSCTKVGFLASGPHDWL